MTDDMQDDENGYLPVSRLAVAAAIVGVASAAAVANPLFLVVPIIGFALSLRYSDSVSSLNDLTCSTIR